jgi:hypothetical protein
MTLDEYQRLAARTSRIEAPTRKLLSAALGLAGKSGLVAARIQKHFFGGRELNHTATADELGAALWYLAEAASSLGISLDDIAAANIEKLKIRYPSND